MRVRVRSHSHAEFQNRQSIAGLLWRLTLLPVLLVQATTYASQVLEPAPEVIEGEVVAKYEVRVPSPVPTGSKHQFRLQFRSDDGRLWELVNTNDRLAQKLDSRLIQQQLVEQSRYRLTLSRLPSLHKYRGSDLLNVVKAEEIAQQR